MSYDPSFPQTDAFLVSAEFRNQFHGIKDLIDAGVPCPQGEPGPVGPQGNNGNDGAPGPQGAAGEVSTQQLTDGLAGTLAAATANSSANTNALATLDAPFTNDPPTPADMELLRAKLNALILALRR